MTEHATLAEALVAFQGAAPKLYKGETAEVVSKRTGGKFSYRYADLADIVERVKPLMHEHGLAFVALPCYADNGSPALKYRLTHKSGDYAQEVMPLLAVNDAQAMGSAITYMRRYALCAVLNLVADADDDGAAAMPQQEGQHKDDTRPAAPLIPRDRAASILQRAMTVGLAKLNTDDAPGTPPEFHPALKAKLTLLGVAKIGELNSDTAEDIEAWLANEPQVTTV